MESQEKEPLNKLTERILRQSGYTDETLGSITIGEMKIARISASIALEIAEKAYNEGFEDGRYEVLVGLEDRSFEDFKKEIL